MSDTERETQERYVMTAQRYSDQQDVGFILLKAIKLITLLMPLFAIIASVAGIIYYVCLR